MTSDTTNASVAQYVTECGPGSPCAPPAEIPNTGYPVLLAGVLGFVLLASGLLLHAQQAMPHRFFSSQAQGSRLS